MDNTQMFQLTLLWALVATIGHIALIKWNPHAYTVAWAKRLVWVCESDGRFVPVPAKLDGIAYKTKNHGLFEFEREDVVSHANKPSIIAYGPYSKANRAKAVPALGLLRKHGINSYNALVELITAELISEAEFVRKQEEAKNKAQGVQA
jgi:hypothetical protein